MTGKDLLKFLTNLPETDLNKTIYTTAADGYDDRLTDCEVWDEGIELEFLARL